MSKSHHPDHNPHDPEASTRFVKISEAYAVLGDAQRRERYDRDVYRATAASTSNVRRGSHSSSSTPYGSRPASGLSKRRTQFRGPPPSFYRSGGWGSQSTKRQAQADAAASASTNAASGSFKNRGDTEGGSEPSGMHSNLNNDVPHFDREAHYRTQEQQDQRRRRRLQEESVDYGGSRGGMLINFLFVGGVLALAGSLPFIFEKKGVLRRKDD